MTFTAQGTRAAVASSPTQVFLSYAGEDRPLAEPVFLALTGQGYDVFFDKDDLHAGADFLGRIKHAVNSCDLFVFIVTEHSVADGSFTLTELEYTQEALETSQGSRRGGEGRPGAVCEDPGLSDCRGHARTGRQSFGSGGGCRRGIEAAAPAGVADAVASTFSPRELAPPTRARTAPGGTRERDRRHRRGADRQADATAQSVVRNHRRLRGRAVTVVDRRVSLAHAHAGRGGESSTRTRHSDCVWWVAL